MVYKRKHLALPVTLRMPLKDPVCNLCSAQQLPPLLWSEASLTSYFACSSFPHVKPPWRFFLINLIFLCAIKVHTHASGGRFLLSCSNTWRLSPHISTFSEMGDVLGHLDEPKTQTLVALLYGAVPSLLHIYVLHVLLKNMLLYIFLYMHI